MEVTCSSCVLTETMHKLVCYIKRNTALAHPVTHIGQEDISGGLSVCGMPCVERGTIRPLPGNGGGGVTRHSAGQRERLPLIDCCYIDWLSDHSRRYCVCVLCGCMAACMYALCVCASVYDQMQFLKNNYNIHVDLAPHLPQLDLFRSEPSKRQYRSIVLPPPHHKSLHHSI